MAQHTPGPWKHDKNASMGGAPIITAPKGWTGGERVIAKVLFHNGSEDPEVIANAKLISQAPRMFELLKLLGARLDLEEQEHHRGIYLGAAYREDIHRIIEAIEGE